MFEKSRKYSVHHGSNSEHGKADAAAVFSEHLVVINVRAKLSLKTVQKSCKTNVQEKHMLKSDGLPRTNPDKLVSISRQ